MPAEYLLLGQHYGVDDVDHTVVSNDVDCGDVCIVDLDAARRAYGQRRSLYSLDHAGLDVFGHHLARNDVISQNGCEFGLVCKQSVQLGLWNLGEGCISRRENSKWALALQGFDQASSLQGSGECVEITCGYG